jgi:hypothetical protein
MWMYRDYIQMTDLKAMNEDIAKTVINSILVGDVLKVLTCLVRIDNFEFDLELRDKYRMLKGTTTADFGIDPYLSLSDPMVIIKEVLIKFDLDSDNYMDILSVRNTSLNFSQFDEE